MLIVAILMMAATALKAQNCETLLLPYFENDREIMEQFSNEVPDKFAWHCAVARSAFYEADAVPADAKMHSITEVKDRFTGAPLPADLVVDLSTLSYYGYTFHDIQLQYPTGAQVICFATPSSKHPYLVLRSIDQTHEKATQLWQQEGHR